MSEHHVLSPLPGIFYRSPAPGQPRFVEPGAPVEADQTVGLVEIMKQFTEIKAGAAGVLTSFTVEDNGTLSPGDVIAVIETK
ncbi:MULTISPECIES: acetyl-CoA carboxylase [Nocardia]|uniref:Biotin carboxyl carrier protein of acetyl-CoA carboxylase n=1 Tax=Nocardia farcinica TaxID=37329 RepID=A0A0H5NDY0_NOCFR|nr:MULTISPECIES: acetyl-CoA carboxylase [Nocardia]SLH35212.1 Biotin carboxyl carrier protein of acetyl-CoA carboxylase [Mycobacteroides abscessus subsp. abscessus]AXK88914.1 biotin carboxyl carrier domain-containing protein [Nocardia farcinica]MBA4857995.1 biotin carboxyl carrier domain-containing protein [Nocardia farcinica]MBC9819256.1 biotin carboxyl carrier domain-containing protein [Nocardia farcinica]MBF6185684.1 biotin carboxyl carrier domain-containing protein [Nocardia farcinica]